jgi:hypothetical protein
MEKHQGLLLEQKWKQAIDAKNEVHTIVYSIEKTLIEHKKNYPWVFYSKVFTMLLELLPDPTKHPTPTHMSIELCLSCTITVLMFREENSMATIARKRERGGGGGGGEKFDEKK